GSRDERPLQDWGVAADGRPYALLGGELLRIGEGGVEARLRVGDDDEALTMAFDRVGAAVLVSEDRCRLWTVALPAMTPGPEHVLPACDEAWLSAFDDRGRSWFVTEGRRAIVVGAAGEVHEYSLPGTGDERLEDIDVIGRGPELQPDTIVAPVADTAFAHPEDKGGQAPKPRAA
ncbi:MAG: hypothetical protein KC457_37450, partial [Myxococcales bacterium]|nr:hypothetical protein [Myxococcales bacterium]